MSIRHELGEFEVNADTIEQARTAAQKRINSDTIALICPWNEKVRHFVVTSFKNKEYVHPITLYKYDGKTFSEIIGGSNRDRPKSGYFRNKDAARADYETHLRNANKRFDAALAHLKAINALGVNIDYCMEGDTHGIYEDYMYLEVTEGAYVFEYRYSEQHNDTNTLTL